MDNKEKVSRAFEIDFLSAQVEQLEKDFLKGRNNVHHAKSSVRGEGSGRARRGGASGRGRSGGRWPQVKPLGRADGNKDSDRGSDTQWRSDRNATQDATQAKVADRIVVDASVLIHALGTVRTWCRESRKEVVIIPLEALNTLDLLKKGTSRTAVQARNATRLLEAQVGTNPRILAQRDDGYIPWKEVFSKVSAESASIASSSGDTGARSPPEIPRVVPAAISLGAAGGIEEPPEWLKRTVCCAKFEQRRPRDALDGEGSGDQIRTVLAISCVPIGHRKNQDSRFSDRAAGTHTSQWADHAGLEVLDVKAEQEAENGARKIQRGSSFSRIDDSDDDFIAADGTEEDISSSEMVPQGDDLAVGDSIPPASVRGDYQSAIYHWKPSGEGKTRGIKLPSPRTPVHDDARGGYPWGRPSGSLVEKPSATIPLTNAGFQPAGKTIRLFRPNRELVDLPLPSPQTYQASASPQPASVADPASNDDQQERFFTEQPAMINSAPASTTEELVDLLRVLEKAALQAVRNKHKIHSVLRVADDTCNYLIETGKSYPGPKYTGVKQLLDRMGQYCAVLDALEEILLEFTEILRSEITEFGPDLYSSWLESRSIFAGILNKLCQPPFPVISYETQDIAEDSFFDDCSWLSRLLYSGIDAEVAVQFADPPMAHPVLAVTNGLHYLESQIKYGTQDEQTRQLVLAIATLLARTLAATSPRHDGELFQRERSPPTTAGRDWLIQALADSFSILNLDTALEASTTQELASKWTEIKTSLTSRGMRALVK